MPRRFEGIVIAGQGQGHAENGKEPAPRGVIDAGDILGQLAGVDEGGEGHGFLGFFVDHDGHADAAIRMAAAA